jgi:DNA helicase-2/ATP-dependent DNA helicase PcrA
LDATINFLQTVLTGFSDSTYGDCLRDEIQSACTATRRKKAATLQNVARILLENPNHVGVAKVIDHIGRLVTSDPAFKDIRIDLARELGDAKRLALFEDPDEGLLQLSARRNFARNRMPPKVISTVHKAKGLERRNVLIIPCDNAHFGDSDAKRCLLYVALSRPIRSLSIVVPKILPSPLCMV